MPEFDKLFKLWVKSAHLFKNFSVFFFFASVHSFIIIKTEEETVLNVKSNMFKKVFHQQNTRKLHTYTHGSSSECNLMNVCGGEHHHMIFNV